MSTDIDSMKLPIPSPLGVPRCSVRIRLDRGINVVTCLAISILAVGNTDKDVQPP